jgi:serine/threonine-protein kinase
MIGKRNSLYEILAKLGEGGMGVVYEAHDSRLQRTLALRFLPASAPADEEARARFLWEARAAAALNHPNSATIYDIEETEDLAFIAMECVEGHDAEREEGPPGAAVAGGS